jgi:hypothetical protein
MNKIILISLVVILTVAASALKVIERPNSGRIPNC